MFVLQYLNNPVEKVWPINDTALDTISPLSPPCPMSNTLLDADSSSPCPMNETLFEPISSPPHPYEYDPASMNCSGVEDQLQSSANVSVEQHKVNNDAGQSSQLLEIERQEQNGKSIIVVILKQNEFDLYRCIEFIVKIVIFMVYMKYIIK